MTVSLLRSEEKTAEKNNRDVSSLFFDQDQILVFRNSFYLEKQHVHFSNQCSGKIGILLLHLDGSCFSIIDLHIHSHGCASENSALQTGDPPGPFHLPSYHTCSTFYL